MKEHRFPKNNFIQNNFNNSPLLTEQVIYCLELVNQLSLSNFDFLFKGGNSQLLILKSPQRFSIDVDIATAIQKDEILEIVKNIVETKNIFSRFNQRVHKTKPWLPMTSFELYYPSYFNSEEENFIMLDVQLKMSQYPKIKKKIKFLSLYQSAAEVFVPTASSLIGDKLLTLGPLTLGIPFKKNKETQRIKHIFDIFTLSNEPLNLKEIRQSVDYCLTQENELQKKNYTLLNVLQDTLKFCASILKYPDLPRGDVEEEGITELLNGITPFNKHLLAGSFDWENLLIAMSKIGLLFTAVYKDNLSEQDLNNIPSLSEQILTVSSPEIFSTLQKKSPIAFQYWKKISDWLGNELSFL